MKKFALAGNPNCGKTTLFNALTGSTAHVGNWPGVTVDKKTGVYKKTPSHVEIIDLPGIYSLSPYTNEEVISRNYLLEEKPDCIINIVDATNLERNLYLTTQLLELNIPVIIALNMMDEVEKNNVTIDIVTLEKKLGVKIVPISALKKQNIDNLMKKAYGVSSETKLATNIFKEASINPLIEKLSKEYQEKNQDNPLFHALKLIENDEIEIKNNDVLLKHVTDYKKDFIDEVFQDDFEAYIADYRYKYISSICQGSIKKLLDDNNKNVTLTKSDKIDKVLTNKWAAIPIFLVLLFIIFHLTFSENLFFLGNLITKDSFANSEFFAGAIYHEGGINSPGVMLQSIFVGFTDFLTSLAGKGLEALGASSWVYGLIVDGVLGGLFAVLSFIPQILLLFLFFSIMEDSGYMARVAFILDRIFRKFGLSGRSFIPLIMGFGCSVPAMINTRTLADEKERISTIRVIPFFSCGAKLPILTAIAGCIVTMFGFANADLITYSMYLVGMITAIITIIIMRKTTLKGDVPPFIMELPAYHLPQARSLLIHLWDKLKHFVKKAFTIILLSTIIIWFLSNFGWDYTYLGEGGIDSSILASIGKLVQPLFTPLGFGSQLAHFGWVFAVAAITGLIAKENVIATFFTLACCIVASAQSGLIDPSIANTILQAGEASEDGVIESVAMAQVTGINFAGLISFIVFNMTTIPCFAAVATAKAELPAKQIGKTIVFWLLTSYVTSMIVYLFLLPFATSFASSWWSWIIVLVIGGLIVLYVYLYNLLRKNKKVSA